MDNGATGEHYLSLFKRYLWATGEHYLSLFKGYLWTTGQRGNITYRCSKGTCGQRGNGGTLLIAVQRVLVGNGATGEHYLSLFKGYLWTTGQRGNITYRCSKGTCGQRGNITYRCSKGTCGQRGNGETLLIAVQRVIVGNGGKVEHYLSLFKGYLWATWERLNITYRCSIAHRDKMYQNNNI